MNQIRRWPHHTAIVKAAVAAALVAMLALPAMTHGALITAGELVVDLRAADLNGSSTTWINQDITGNTVGNFSTVGGGNVAVASIGSVSKAVYVNATAGNPLRSVSAVPVAVTGNNTRSVETWIYAETLAASQGVVCWGSTANNQFCRFTYAGSGNGLLSAWFNDAGWGGATLPTGQWVHVVWTWDGTNTARGYINGGLEVTTGMNTTSILATASTIVTLGASRTAANVDLFDGYIADVRVHTGLLSDADVLNNYNQGIYSPASGAPSITGLNNQTVAPGNNVFLNPTVTGTAPIFYQWRENGANMTNQTNATLTLLNVQTGQNGYIYSLIASNSIGAATNSMMLTVAGVQLTLSLDINTSAGNNYTGTAIAEGSGTYWNSFVVPAASTLTLTDVRDANNTVTASDITINRISGANFSSWDNSGGGGNPNPVPLMRDYLFSGPYGVTITDLAAGTYHLFAYAHGDNTGQASTVTVNAANGGASGSTTDVGNYRDIYQTGAEGNSYLKLIGTVGGSGTFSFTTTYLNGFQLQLLSAPTISSLTNRTVVAGTSPVLSPAIAGIPTPSFQWRSNNVAIGGATNASLTLNNVQYAQNGAVYSLVASNVVGAVTNSMTLTVIVTPTITGLNNQAVQTGGTVTIAPTVSGVPSPTLKWLFNGSLVTDGATGNGSTISGSTSSTLVITSGQPADSGTYSLVASNSAGVVTNSMTLTVASGNVAPSIVGPTDQTVVQSNNATFTASASGLPLPTLQWRVNGTDIIGATSSSLTVSNVQYAQNGNVYSLVASNVAGTQENSATLYVLVPAAISQQPTNLSVVIGSPVLFSVSASGVPAVKYQWRKNGSPLANATNATYSIGSAQGSDNGAVFSVVVSNSVGVVTSSNATLTVLSTMTGSFRPTNNAAGISPDQQLRIVFSSTPKIGSGKLYVRDAANHSLLATIDVSQFQTFTMFGATISNAAVRSVQGASYYYMPIAIYGNEAWITLNSSNRFAYNKTYYVNTDAGLFVDASNAAFPAVTGTNTWRFSTKPSGPATPTASTGPTNLTIALDGAGDFATLQGASDWVPQNNTLKRTITIQPGVYRDNTTFAQSRNNVMIIGAGTNRQSVQLFYPYPAFSSASGAGTLRLESSDIYVRNLTIDNAVYLNYNGVTFAGPIQTLQTTGSRLIFDNVLIKGGQDTLYTINGIAYFNRCEIWGSVDFIYGAALAVFDQCDIVEIRNTGGPITAPNTDLAAPYGLTFLNCNFPRALIANGYPYDVGTGNTTMQRPWRQDGYTALINCAVGSQISTKGWAEWDGRETTCRAREIGTTLIGGGTVTPAQRQAAGAYWLNTIDPDYVSNPSLDPTNALLFGSPGKDNRVAVTINTNDFTLPAIFGHAYYNLGGWLPTTLPTVTGQPTNKTVNAGSAAAFSVAAYGLPSPTYQWRKNGTNLVGEVGTTLNIVNVQAGDAGTYSVIVSNSAGAISSSNATLTVAGLSAPVITTQPTNQTSAVGGTVSFTVVATGVPTPVFQWLKNGTIILNATNSSLTISNVQVTDAAVYSVIASNSVSTATSSNATLTVTGPNGFSMVNGSTTGGQGGTVVTVANGTDFNTQINVAGPRIIQVQGPITIGRVSTTANKTIIGLGTNATLLGNLNISGVSNVIVQNLRITDPGGDGITIRENGALPGSHHVWVDHCTFYDCGDGACDISVGADNVTVSWCKFIYPTQLEHKFTMIADGQLGNTNSGHITLHHNWWSTGADQRMAASSYARVHYYNNYFNCTNNSYSSNARTGTEIKSENNFYSGVNDPIGVSSGTDGKIQTSGNIYSGCAGTIHPGTDSVFSPPYVYALDATVDVPAIVMAGAGAPGPNTVPIPSKVWDGGGADNNLNTANNWGLNENPKEYDTLLLAGSTRLTPNNNFTANSEFSGLTFSNNAGAFVLGGNALNFGNAITDDSGAVQTINLNLDFTYSADHFPMSRVFNVTSPGGSLVINGNIAGFTNIYNKPYSVTKLGPGLLTLAGLNTFPGALNLNGGLVRFSTLSNLGGTNLTFGGGGLQWAPGNTADISGYPVAINAGGATFDTGNNNVTLANRIGNNGVGSLTKLGVGTLLFGGTNTYTGPTTVSNGTLIVNGSIPGGVTVVPGATLGGSGIIRGSVTLAAGSTFAPGASIGTLTVSNNLTLGGNLAVEVNTAASPSNDLCVVTGTLTNSGSSFLTVANLGPALDIGNSFKLFSKAMPNGGAFTITPAPGPGLAWTNKLAIDGTIAVVASGPANYTERIYAVTTANQLISFQSATPGTVLSSVLISGLQGADQILGVDFVGDTFYAVGNSSRLYTLNRATGEATLVGQFTPVISGSWAGVEAEPAGLRVVTDLDQQLVLNLGSGAATAGATLVGSPNPTLSGLAYHPGTGVRYVADYVQNTIGTLDPSTGLVTPIGATTIDFSRNNGFDISGRSAYTTYLATPAASSDPAANLYTINLATGAASLVGLIGNTGDNILIRGLAVGPEFSAAPAVNLNPTNITFSASGGNLNLSWPSDHLGWRLEVQTNTLGVGLRTNWFTVPGSAATNQASLPINPVNGSVFYRLVYP